MCSARSGEDEGEGHVHHLEPKLLRKIVDDAQRVGPLRGARRPLTVRRDSGWSAGRTFSALTDTFLRFSSENKFPLNSFMPVHL